MTIFHYKKEIADFFDSLESKIKNTNRYWWPRYFFHCTDILNAIEILKNNGISSRNKLESEGENFVDIASDAVIDGTSEKWKKYSRLYMRPKTPTQYHNEGFRPKSLVGCLNAHCPVPVYFLFDSKAIASRDDVIFSDGNLGSQGVLTGNGIEFLKSLDFERIYHNEPLTDDYSKRNIIFHRCAEVIVPDFLDLAHLKLIMCRSQAEKMTLLNMLTSGESKRFANKISCSSTANLFFQRWFYVDSVDLDSERMIFKFIFPAVRETFHCRINVKDNLTGKIFSWEKDAYDINGSLVIYHNVDMSRPRNYTVELFLDSHIACKNEFNELNQLELF